MGATDWRGKWRKGGDGGRSAPFGRVGARWKAVGRKAIGRLAFPRADRLKPRRHTHACGGGWFGRYSVRRAIGRSGRIRQICPRFAAEKILARLARGVNEWMDFVRCGMVDRGGGGESELSRKTRKGRRGERSKAESRNARSFLPRNRRNTWGQLRPPTVRGLNIWRGLQGRRI